MESEIAQLISRNHQITINKSDANKAQIIINNFDAKIATPFELEIHFSKPSDFRYFSYIYLH